MKYIAAIIAAVAAGAAGYHFYLKRKNKPNLPQRVAGKPVIQMSQMDAGLLTGAISNNYR